ncbi:3-ketoacyl-ACP reductase [Tabrizicola sp. J26]|uniref:3-ketoacyl-ACP reductase n=1 Tax=Alitabrizicola rongguiensis TaxID=2909234 RepID=UPI001F20A1AA|nr:3-ketoacyl-ACP reductase [Tabrizicola rongguiensis]MCF1707539.1 3-ketoacyl-ACP reductase [Tabrizicola rongguiensis]
MKRVALVTGASRGIGLSAAKALAHEGFAVALNGLPDDADLPVAVKTVRALGGDALAVPMNVTDLAAHAAMIERIETELGPLTTLVNNAGVGVMQRGDPLEVTEASYDRCQAVNAKAMFFLTQAFARRVIGRERNVFHAIVNVTSSNATAVAEPRAEYAMSKAAAAMASKTWAVRLAREGIHVYDVQPGLIATDMTAAVIDSYRARAEAGLTLLPRVGTPDEMGTIIASLASGRLPYTTGQVISADGGLLVPRF